MNFLELQEDLDTLIGENRDDWLPDTAGDDSKGKKLKNAVKFGLGEVHKRLAQNELYKEQNSLTVLLSLELGKADLPTDFSYDIKIDFNTERRIDKLNQKIVFADDTYNGDITLTYMQKEKVLVGKIDVPFLNDHFHDVVAFYALEKYHLSQYDNANAGQAVAYAEDKIEDLISKYY